MCNGKTAGVKHNKGPWNWESFRPLHKKCQSSHTRVHIHTQSYYYLCDFIGITYDTAPYPNPNHPNQPHDPNPYLHSIITGLWPCEDQNCPHFASRIGTLLLTVLQVKERTHTHPFSWAPTGLQTRVVRQATQQPYPPPPTLQPSPQLREKGNNRCSFIRYDGTFHSSLTNRNSIPRLVSALTLS